MFAQLRVADELERLRVCRDAARDERADFFQPSGCEHRIGACVDARVQRGARRLQADFDYFVALQRIAAAAMDFAHRFSGEQAQFDRSDYFLRVRRRDARRGFGIETREHAMKMIRTAQFGRMPEAHANFFGALRRLGQAFEQRSQIQPSSSGEDRQNLARAQIRQGMERATAIITCRENLSGLAEIHQVMRNAVLFGRGNFRSTNIEVPIDLRRIADQYFAAKFFGEPNSQRGFAGSGGSKHHDEPRQRAHPENFQ